MALRRSFLDRRQLFIFFISIPCTILLLIIVHGAMHRWSFTGHVTMQYYLRLLRITLPLLPFMLLLSSFLPLRRKFDYGLLLKRFSPRAFLLCIITLSLGLTVLIALLYYDHIPQGDAVVTLFQAKIFASGHLWTHTPRMPDFFLNEMVSNGNRWFSMVQKGHAFWLTPFLLLRIPWLLGPLLGTCSLILFFFFMKNCFDASTAREGTVLLLFSPFFLFISASHLNQNSSLLLIMLGLFLVSHSVKKESNALPFFAGVATGLAFLSRSTVMLFVPAYMLLLALSKRNRIRAPLLFIAGFLPTCSLQFLFNGLYTGHPLRFAYQLHVQSNLHAIGFGAAKGMPTYGIIGHSPLKALINLCYNMLAFSLHLFGWPLLSLIFIPFAFWRWKRNRWDLFALALIGSAIVFFSFYWFHGISPMGPKYYFEICPLLVLLTVRGIRQTRMRALAGIFLVANMLVYIPCAVQPFRGAWGTNNHCYNEVRRLSLKDALVFVQDLPGESQFATTVNRHNYLSVAFRNHPTIEKGSIIFAKSLGDPKNRQLIGEYQERDAFLFEYTRGIEAYHLIPYAPEKNLRKQ